MKKAASLLIFILNASRPVYPEYNQKGGKTKIERQGQQPTAILLKQEKAVHIPFSEFRYFNWERRKRRNYLSDRREFNYFPSFSVEMPLRTRYFNWERREVIKLPSVRHKALRMLRAKYIYHKSCISASPIKHFFLLISPLCKTCLSIETVLLPSTCWHLSSCAVPELLPPPALVPTESPLLICA